MPGRVRESADARSLPCPRISRSARLRQRMRTVHHRVAADVSRRHIRCGKNAPTDVGSYQLLVNRVWDAISWLEIRPYPRSSARAALESPHSCKEVAGMLQACCKHI